MSSRLLMYNYETPRLHVLASRLQLHFDWLHFSAQKDLGGNVK